MKTDTKNNQVDQFVELQKKDLTELLGMAEEAGVTIENASDKAHVINKLIAAGWGLSDEGLPVGDNSGGVQAGVTFALKLRDQKTDPEGYKEDAEFIRDAKDRIFKNQSAGKTVSALLKNREGKHYMRSLPAVKITKPETFVRVLKMVRPVGEDQAQEKFLDRVKKNEEAFELYLVRVQRAQDPDQPRRAFKPGQRDLSVPLSNYVMLYAREIIENPTEETI